MKNALKVKKFIIKKSKGGKLKDETAPKMIKKIISMYFFFFNLLNL